MEIYQVNTGINTGKYRPDKQRIYHAVINSTFPLFPGDTLRKILKLCRNVHCVKIIQIRTRKKSFFGHFSGSDTVSAVSGESHFHKVFTPGKQVKFWYFMQSCINGTLS